MSSEKLLERKLVTAVKLKGGVAVKLTSPSFNGLPDRLILMPQGRVCFAEIKTTGQKLRPIQLVVKAMLEKLGFVVWVIDDETSLINCLNSL